jgi:hypothetical protein
MTHAAAEERRAKIEAMITELLDGWIASNPCPNRPAWHPYPASLRIINWIKTLYYCPKLASDSRLKSLYSQALFLERNLEGHLMANHFLENGRALLFAGLFFEGDDARRWFSTGVNILKQEIVEEWLPQGGHFERSPMYHAILTEGLLDTYVLLAANGCDVEWLRISLIKMCEWLESIRTPDGWYPMFNDAAIGISASSDEILSNAERIIDYRPRSSSEPVRNCDGFYILQNKVFFCAIDGAPIGPDYNPGHAHADNLSYEAWFKEEKLVVDPGTYTYEKSALRNRYRSSESHNTVVINNVDQSEVWGGFRVARRSHPRACAGRFGDMLVFLGKYENRVDPSQGIKHERIFITHSDNFILVWDMIYARGAICADSYCQFAPTWSLYDDSHPGFRLQHKNGAVLFCTQLGKAVASRLDGNYAPEFGCCRTVDRIRFHSVGAEQLGMGYVITTEPPVRPGNVAVSYDKDSFKFGFGAKSYEVNLKELAL